MKQTLHQKLDRVVAILTRMNELAELWDSYEPNRYEAPDEYLRLHDELIRVCDEEVESAVLSQLKEWTSDNPFRPIIFGDHSLEEFGRSADRERTLHKVRTAVMRVKLGRTGAASSSHRPLQRADPKSVFVVHGHEEGLRLEVVALLKSLKLHPVILQEKPNRGQTLIEKLEAHGRTAFAVVLFTGDDAGHKKGFPDQSRPRPRQNVVLEYGYFAGVLGRKNVAAIVGVGIEIPSDLEGLGYIAFDPSGAWKTKLVKELKAAGLEVDLNAFIENA